MAGTVRAVRITDTTLRDGSHAMSHQFTQAQVKYAALRTQNLGPIIVVINKVL